MELEKKNITAGDRCRHYNASVRPSIRRAAYPPQGRRRVFGTCEESGAPKEKPQGEHANPGIVGPHREADVLTGRPQRRPS